MIWNFRMLISRSKSSFWHMSQRIYLTNPKIWDTLVCNDLFTWYRLNLSITLARGSVGIVFVLFFWHSTSCRSATMNNITEMDVFITNILTFNVNLNKCFLGSGQIDVFSYLLSNFMSHLSLSLGFYEKWQNAMIQIFNNHTNYTSTVNLPEMIICWMGGENVSEWFQIPELPHLHYVSLRKINLVCPLKTKKCHVNWLLLLILNYIDNYRFRWSHNHDINVQLTCQFCSNFSNPEMYFWYAIFSVMSHNTLLIISRYLMNLILESEWLIVTLWAAVLVLCNGHRTR